MQYGSHSDNGHGQAQWTRGTCGCRSKAAPLVWWLQQDSTDGYRQKKKNLNYRITRCAMNIICLELLRLFWGRIWEEHRTNIAWARPSRLIAMFWKKLNKIRLCETAWLCSHILKGLRRAEQNDTIHILRQASEKRTLKSGHRCNSGFTFSMTYNSNCRRISNFFA